MNLTICTKINLKYIIDLNINAKTLELLQVKLEFRQIFVRSQKSNTEHLKF